MLLFPIVVAPTFLVKASSPFMSLLIY